MTGHREGLRAGAQVTSPGILRWYAAEVLQRANERTSVNSGAGVGPDGRTAQHSPPIRKAVVSQRASGASRAGNELNTT